MGYVLALAAAIALTVTSGCQSFSATRDWDRYETHVADLRVEYAFPPDGVVGLQPTPIADTAFSRREKVKLFAVVGYHQDRSSSARPPTRLSLGLGQVPGGPLPQAPTTQDLGDRILAETRAAGHADVDHAGSLRKIGGTQWFELVNIVPSSGGVQPEAVIYYRPLTGSLYLFVWGFWEKAVRQTPADVEKRREMLERVVGTTRVSSP